MKTRLPLSLAAAGALALAGASAASAGTLTLPGACLPNNEILPITGTGFTPNGEVDFSGSGLASPLTGYPDATGAFQRTFLTPNRTSYVPQTVTLTATDTMNPALTTTVQYQVVHFGSNAPLSGRPGNTTTWEFAGFTGGKPIYGHYRYGGKTYSNHRFGLAQGPCGALKVRAKRLPTKIRNGKWTLQIDQSKTYHATTRPAFKTSFTIYRTFS